jgi:hypothetical protein
MSDPYSTRGRLKLENLELHKETLQELTEGEAEDAQGGGLLSAVCDGAPSAIPSCAADCKIADALNQPRVPPPSCDCWQY